MLIIIVHVYHYSYTFTASVLPRHGLCDLATSYSHVLGKLSDIYFSVTMTKLCDAIKIIWNYTTSKWICYILMANLTML